MAAQSAYAQPSAQYPSSMTGHVNLDVPYTTATTPGAAVPDQGAPANATGLSAMSVPMSSMPPYGQPPAYGAPMNRPDGSFAPGLNGVISSDMAAQLGLAYGEHAFNETRKIIDQNVNRYINLPALKYYFAVSNGYVVKKLRLLLFPFANKSWNRLQRPDQSGYAPPRDDTNAPDMYIPLMAFVTFTLLVGFVMGQRNQFNPEILGLTLSKGVAVVVFEVLFIKFGSYLLNISADVPWFDLIAYCGYKFVGMILVLLMLLIFGSNAFWIAVVYTSITLAFFLLRSLRQNLVVTESASTQSPYRRRRNYFLLAIAASQVLSSYFLLLF